MSVVEACLLLRALMEDPRSKTAAAVSGWAFPASTEWMMLARLHDALIDTTPGVKHPESYHVPRPWKGAKRRAAKKSMRSPEQVRKILRPNR